MPHWLDLRGALAGAGAIGRAVHRFHPDKPAPTDVAELFGDAAPLTPAAIARSMSGLRYQNQLLVLMAQRRGAGVLEPYIDPTSVERLKPFASRGPCLFLTWHIGPPFGILGAFTRAGLKYLSLRRTAGSGIPGLAASVAKIDHRIQDRSNAVIRAVSQLKNGGLVIIAADGVDTAETLAAPCLGRAAQMARGPFALARISGAPVVPLLARWDADGWIRIAIGDPLQGEGSRRALESSLAAAAGAWLEAYLLNSPGQLRRCSLQWLLDSPRLEQADARAVP